MKAAWYLARRRLARDEDGIRTALTRQDGVALPVAMAVLLLVSILVAGLSATAVQSAHDATNDRDGKRALASAEAGLHVAASRLNAVKPASGLCLTNVPVAPLASGECPGHTESMGNGAQYTYHVTPVLSASAVCATVPGQPTENTRCITSTGVVGEATRRVQVRVSAGGVFLFADAGMVGDKLIDYKNSAEIYSSVGTNGHIELGNSGKVEPGALLLAPGATYALGNGTFVSGGIEAHAPFVFPAVDFAPSLPPGGANDNASIPASFFRNGDRATRELILGNSDELTLAAGTYNLCDIKLVNSNKVKVPGDGVVRIFLDSPARPGSGCGAGNGRLVASNSLQFNQEAGKPENLELYVYGTFNEAAGGSDLEFVNSAHFFGSIYAPNSTVQDKDSGEFHGGIAAKNIVFVNSGKFWPSDALKLKPFGSGGPAVRVGWFECREQPANPADPESGC